MNDATVFFTLKSLIEKGRLKRSRASWVLSAFRKKSLSNRTWEILYKDFQEHVKSEKDVVHAVTDCYSGMRYEYEEVIPGKFALKSFEAREVLVSYPQNEPSENYLRAAIKADRYLEKTEKEGKVYYFRGPLCEWELEKR